MTKAGLRALGGLLAPNFMTAGMKAAIGSDHGAGFRAGLWQLRRYRIETMHLYRECLARRACSCHDYGGGDGDYGYYYYLHSERNYST